MRSRRRGFSFLFRRRHLRTYPNDLFLVGDLGIRPVRILVHLFQLVSPDEYLLVWPGITEIEWSTHCSLSCSSPRSLNAAESAFSISASSSAKMASSSSSMSSRARFDSTTRDAKVFILASMVAKNQTATRWPKYLQCLLLEIQVRPLYYCTFTVDPDFYTF